MSCTIAILNSISTPYFNKCCTRSLFNWNFGKNNKTTDDKPQFRYHDLDLPFPPSLISKTFLKGTSFFLSLSFKHDNNCDKELLKQNKIHITMVSGFLITGVNSAICIQLSYT